MKRYKCIIFDLDGTMLDTERMNIVPLQRVIKEELNKDVSYESLLKYMGCTGKKALEYLGIKDIERVYDKWVQYVNEFEDLNVNPKDCMYIGDTLSDYKATKAAGMDFWLALWGARDISEIKADYEFENPIDILEVI